MTDQLVSHSPFALDGRSALVTGASRGLGRSIAIGLAKAGADMAVIARDRDALVSCAGAIEALGRKALVVPADVTDPSQVRDAFAAIDASFGALDILVNNAGTNIRKPTIEATDDDWRDVLRINLDSTFLCVREAARRMAASGRGSIVLMGSVAGQIAIPTGIAYAATKGAIAQMTRTLAQELGPAGVRVNCVAPWYFRTPLTAPLLDKPEYLERVLRITPLGRVGRPDEDLTPVVVFLASDASAYVTGQVIAVDGGMSTSGFHP